MEGICIKKKITTLVLILLTVLLLMLGKVTAKAADGATEIKVNTKVYGVINEKYGSEWYSFTTPERGYYTIDFGMTNVTQKSASQSWDVTLYDSNRNVIKNWTNTGFSSDKFSTATSSIYYIQVKYGYDVIGVGYNFTINNTADTRWEDEYNNSEATATVLPINTDVYGMISYKGDLDVYKFTVPNQNGYFVASLSHENIADNGSWRMSICMGDGTEVWSSSGKTLSSGIINYKPGTVMYIKIKDDYSTNFQPYKLRINFTENNLYELEKNDNQNEATPIVLGNEYTGLLDGHSGETDWYFFAVTGNSEVTVEFGPKDVANTGNWNVNLVNSAAKEYKLASTSTRTAAKLNLSPGIYYINIKNDYNTSWKQYTVKVTAQAISNVKTPKIKKVTIKNGYINGYLKSIKMSKSVGGEVDYEVKVSAKKNMKKPLLVTTADAGKTIKTFGKSAISKKKKTYYVQVRPCVTDCFGNNIYVGAKSNVYKAKGKK